VPRQDAREINADSKTNDCRYTGSRGKVFAEEQGEGIAEERSCVVTSHWSALRANDGHIVRLYRFAWLLARGLIMIARVFVRPSVYHPVSVYKVLYVNRIPVPVYLVPTHLFLHRSLLLIHHSAHL